MANPKYRGGGYGELVSGIQEDASKRILAASPTIRSKTPFTDPMPVELACLDPEALARIRNPWAGLGCDPSNQGITKAENMR